jgi:hypothetical protein
MGGFRVLGHYGTRQRKRPGNCGSKNFVLQHGDLPFDD